MASPVAFTDEVEVDFGCPFPRTWKKLVDGLPDDMAVELATFKANLDAGNNPPISGVREVLRQLAAKFLVERAAREDLIQFGWTLESWGEICREWKTYWIHCIFGGNRSSKSVFAARLVVKLAMEIPEAKIYCFHVNDAKSVAEQQAYVWEALPDRYKTMPKKKGANFDVQYTQKNGFVGMKCILPPLPGHKRGSEIVFMTYQQYKIDPQVVEGWWAHFIWCDEECPLKMFERLLTRLYDAHGRMLLTFTTIQGWSPLVAEMIGKVKTLRKRFSKLLGREIPVAQESLTRPGARIYYFWTEDNPFIPSDTILKLKGRPEAEILSVAHGIPTKAANACFPSFDEEIHVLPHEKLPWLTSEYLRLSSIGKAPEFTDYMGIDPAGAGDKAWFILWVRVDARGAMYVWHEFPDESYGPWSIPSDNPMEGKPGPGQSGPQISSTGEYAELMSQIEGEFRMQERTIDPRMSAAKVTTKDGATTILSELEAAMQEQKIHCEVIRPAPGLNISHGLQLIKDRLAYDRNKPIGAMNAPKLYISNRCTNTIDAMKNYTNRGTKDDANKDPIDVLRYLLENGVEFVSSKDVEVSGQTFSY